MKIAAAIKSRKVRLLGFILLLIIFQVFIAGHITVDMSDIGKAPDRIILSSRYPALLSINIATVLNAWLIMAILIGGGYFIGKRLKEPPGKLQVMAEMVVSGFDSICQETMGKSTGRKYLPLVLAIFLFVLLSNWIAVIPTFWQIVGRSDVHAEESMTLGTKVTGFFFPAGRVEPLTPEWLAFEEPTKDLNTTLGLGIMCFFIAHISGVIYKGWKKYVAEYFSPMWFMFPLNVVGEVGKTLSHSFRLFGNIMGGGIIIAVVLRLLIKFLMFTPFLLPAAIGLNVFFGLFVGLVQAFVFAMLAMTYVAVMITE